jgi:hypothetical protein
MNEWQWLCASEYSDEEECDHVSSPETDSDGDNFTASADSDADSETGGFMKQKIDKFGINYLILWVITGNTIQL